MPPFHLTSSVPVYSNRMAPPVVVGISTTLVRTHNGTPFQSIRITRRIDIEWSKNQKMNVLQEMIISCTEGTAVSISTEVGGTQHH